MVVPSRFTKKEWFVLTILCIINFYSALTTSIQAPFYPQEAEKKGTTATEYGLVFGVYSLVAFIVCPIYGKYIEVIGVKRVLNVGVIVAGLSTMAFGLLEFVSSHVPFVAGSFLVRIVQSLGASAATTACFSITAAVFPGHVATIFATVEIFYGLGNIIGPAVGGYFFELGGFMCPFMVSGGSLLILESFIFFALSDTQGTTVGNRTPAMILSFLKLKPVILDMFGIAAVSMGFWFYGATLEPHLRQFNLTPRQTGAVFVSIGATYSVASPIVGKLCDDYIYPKKIIIVGSVLSLVSFVLAGPAPYVPVSSTLWMTCLGLVFQGLAMACILVSAFIDAIRSAVECGLPDDISTYGMVSGISTSSFALGAFLGPSIAGVLLDAVGFRRESLFMQAVLVILFISVTWYVKMERRPETKRLLSNGARWQDERGATHAQSDSAETEDTCALIEVTPNSSSSKYGSIRKCETASPF